jgi:dipeptidyl aminopeptidase/acylaminoacyl peptidase
MLVYVIYPPDFNPAKKYPALLFCQGGPSVSLNSILFLPVEFSADGGQWLHRDST